jgi:4-amino-4-deoxy-L-arabinose transferase-like glycosyltransferase
MRSNTKIFLLIIELIVFLSLCYFPLCYRIDALSIRQWDEARNAVNAMEMLQNKNYIVRYYENMPEVWETKPPLLVWLQVISMKIFGINELAIRFPVIIATFLTVLLLIWYFSHYHQNRYIGYLASLVLVTSQGYIDRHIARTGDHDALLILFLTAIFLYVFRYLILDKPKPHLLISIALLFALGVLTKSVTTFFVLPGLLASVFVFRAGRKLFYNGWLYIALLIFMLIIGGYYCTRELMQPGYLKAVWHWELLPRYVNSENNFDSGTFWQYGKNFFNSRYTFWIYLLFPSLVLLPFLLKGETRIFYIYLLINIVFFFLVISLGSKGLWYDGPLYPLFAITIAMFLYHSYRYIAVKFQLKTAVKTIVVTVVSILIFVNPGIAIMKKVSQSYEYSWDLEYFAIAYFLRDKNNLEELPGNVKVAFDGYNAHLLFYVEAINFTQQNDPLSLKDFSSVKPQDIVLISQESMLDSIKTNFDHEVILARDPVKLIRIGDRLPRQPASL